MKKQIHLSSSVRKDQILTCAINLSKKVGYQKIKLTSVAKEAKVSSGLVLAYFKNMEQLRKTVMAEAVKQSISVIVAQGLSVSDPIAQKASSQLKKKAINLLTR